MKPNKTILKVLMILGYCVFIISVSTILILKPEDNLSLWLVGISGNLTGIGMQSSLYYLKKSNSTKGMRP